MPSNLEKHMTTYEQKKTQLLNNMGTRFIVKEMIKILDQKDIVDALNDLDTVKELMELKYREMMENQTHNNVS